MRKSLLLIICLFLVFQFNSMAQEPFCIAPDAGVYWCGTHIEAERCECCLDRFINEVALGLDYGCSVESYCNCRNTYCP